MPKHIKTVPKEVDAFVLHNFHYDKETGELYRRTTETLFKPCGSTNSQGYLDVDLRKAYGKVVARNTRVHRIIWFLSYGVWPDFIIDHIDRDKQNNKLSNLRQANQSLNQMNAASRRKKSCPFKGVCPSPGVNKWRAYIGIGGGKTKHLGVFNCPTLAALCYDKEARTRFGDFARLNFPFKGEQSAMVQ